MVQRFRAGGNGLNAPKLKLSRVVTDIRVYAARVKRKEAAARKRGLIRQAAFCKGIARRMIQPSKDGKPSKPGKPPRMQDGKGTLRRSIQWGWSNTGQYSVAGPIVRTTLGVTRALEHGGTSRYLRKKGKKKITGRQQVRPRPFMKKALKLTLRDFPKQFRKTFRR